jgi:outer membrane protein assembly factor BamB
MKEAQWGFASSPVIHAGRVLVQCDVQEGSFIAAYDLASGDEVWRTPRDEVPTWGTPTVYRDGDRELVAVNGFKHIGAYDFADGSEVWRMEGGGDIPVPTPVVAHELVFITNAHGPMSPVYAVRSTARGTLDPESGSDGIAWWHKRGGNYMQTPIVVGDHLFCCRDMGILTCFDARTGEKLYSERLRTGDTGFGFTASAVSDGKKLYFCTEDGRALVVAAGAEFSLLADNDLGGPCMATPALAGGALLVRTRHELLCLKGGG